MRFTCIKFLGIFMRLQRFLFDDNLTNNQKVLRFPGTSSSNNFHNSILIALLLECPLNKKSFGGFRRFKMREICLLCRLQPFFEIFSLNKLCCSPKCSRRTVSPPYVSNLAFGVVFVLTSYLLRAEGSLLFSTYV